MKSPVDTSDVRRHNLSLVLRHIHAHRPCVRTEVAAATGLVHASVSGLVAELRERGLVREVGAAAPGTGSRSRRLLEVVPGRAVTVAAQVSLEHLRFMATDLAGDVVHQAGAPHRAPHGDPHAMAVALARGIGEAVDAVRAADPDTHLAQVVVAMAGPVLGPQGTVAAALDFGWPATDLRSLVGAELTGLDCPLDVVNDADTAALAEYHALLERGARLPGTVAYVKADTGVGGALLIDRRIHTGSHGIAGEAGHIPVDLDGPPCDCGGRGCLAGHVGPVPLTTAAGLGELVHARGVDVALAELDRRLHAGDPVATAALRRAGEALGAAVLAVVMFTGAAEVILGGYLATWSRWLAPGLDARLAGLRATLRTDEPRITAGVLGRDATLLGATRTGCEAVLDDPTSVPVRTSGDLGEPAGQRPGRALRG